METDDRAHGLGPTRTRVLAVLQDAEAGLHADDVAGQLAMHPNSVRFHLDGLAEQGLVARELEPRSTRGRPRVRYRATAAAPQVTGRRYRQLSEMLTVFLQEELPDPADAAERIGRAWSATLPVPPTAEDQPTEDQTTEDQTVDAGVIEEALVPAMDEIGFDSRVVDTPDAFRVEVDHCPFLEVARGHEDVVCAIHLGLMRGLLDRTAPSVTVRRLEPLVEPGLCLAHLSR